jgi:hypothetical protein
VIVLLSSKVSVLSEGKELKKPLIANDEGIWVGKVGMKLKRGLLKKKLTIYVPYYPIVAWDEVTGYDISAVAQSMFDSDIGTNHTILTLRTQTTPMLFKFRWTDPTAVQTKLGPFLARLDTRT